MRKNIMRTITVTAVESATVTFKQGKPVANKNDTLYLNGIIKEDKALKTVRKTYGLDSHITRMDTKSATYEISVEDFMKYATKVEPPAAEQEGK